MTTSDAAGDAALLEYARKFDGFEGASVRITPRGSLTPDFERAVFTAAANIRDYARLQLPQERFVDYPDGRRLGQIVRPLDSMGAYTPAGRYPLPSTLLMNVIPAQVAGVKTTCVACPHPSAEILGLASWLGVTHFFQMGGAQAIAALAYGTETVPRVDRIVGPGNIYVAAAKKLIAGDTGIDFVAGPTEIVIIAAEGDPKARNALPAWIAADMLAQAEHDVDASAILLNHIARACRIRCGRDRASALHAPYRRGRPSIHRDQRRHRDRRFTRSSRRIFQRPCAGASGFARFLASRFDSKRRLRVFRPRQPRSRGRLRLRSQSRPAYLRSGPPARRPLFGRLRESDFRAGIETRCTGSIDARHHDAGSRRRSGSPRAFSGGSSSRSPARCLNRVPPCAAWLPILRPRGGREGKLRLDFNENTVGCSPRVIEALTQYLTADHLSIYPEYAAALHDLAAFFGVQSEEFTLTNGTDEAIQLLVNTFLDDGACVLMMKPTYAMYKFYSQLAGAAVREIDYPAGLQFPLDDFLAAIEPSTRAILISNPNNPTGSAIGLDAIRRILDIAPHAAVLIDEAYFDFCGVTALPWVRDYRNLFVSRTFSKVYGMAAMRCGCLFSSAENMQWVRKAQSPYSVNALAAVAARAAVKDAEYVKQYVAEVLEAREQVCRGFDQLGIRYFPSLANFVLFDAGDRAIPIRDALRERGVLVRDRSYEISGCVRVTIGTRAGAERFMAELWRLWKK